MLVVRTLLFLLVGIKPRVRVQLDISLCIADVTLSVRKVKNVSNT